MKDRKSIEFLRYVATLFSFCNESFNQRFSELELLQLAKSCQAPEWDFFPDQWEERQIQECIRWGMTPQWEEKDGKIVPKFQ